LISLLSAKSLSRSTLRDNLLESGQNVLQYSFVRVPKSDHAIVDKSKIVDYLLCAQHPDGAPKAAFFNRFGFSVNAWKVFAKALREHAMLNRVQLMVETSFGIRYSVEGRIHSPDGRDPVVRSVWISENSEGYPRLITAYPVKE
jgi:hypothetical protein